MPNISNAARDIPQLFKPELQKDEKILWSGQPVPQIFSPEDIFLIPFSLLWGGFAFFWEGSVLHELLTKPKAGGLIFMAFWGIPFVCIGLYIIFGRFIFNHWAQKNTFYALTNQRVLILSTYRGRALQALFLDNLPTISKTIKKNGLGTLAFGETQMNLRMGQGGAGFNPYSNRRVAPTPAFANIKDANKVYELIAKQHKKD